MTNCPLYKDERLKLYSCCRNNARECLNFYLIPTEEQKFVYILSNKNIAITRSFGNFVVKSFILREEAYLRQSLHILHKWLPICITLYTTTSLIYVRKLENME